MIYTCRSFPDDLLARFPELPRPTGKRVGKNKRKYLSAVCAFDIETTRLPDPWSDYSVMYIWQLQIDRDVTIIGRNWKEFQIAVKRLIRDLPDDVYLVVLVHNLAFEFQFLRGIYDFKPEEVFCVQPRKPLRADMYGHIELRCTYLHTNMRLDTYLEKMGVPDQKLTYDYEKQRYPWTPLSSSELAYCINDVKGLVEAYQVEMQHDGDTLYTVPATSTGYVRRDCKAALKKYRWAYIHEMLPDLETYHMLREAFRGGDVHANRYYAGLFLKNVRSRDRSSSYPEVQLNHLFPVKPFHHRRVTSWEDMLRLINVRKKPVLARLAFWDIRLRDQMEGAPYIPYDKSRSVIRPRMDNGRILAADYLEITVTDIDLKIILDQYVFSARRVIDLEYSTYGPLPEELLQTIRTYYRLKTELKGVKDQELLYGKSKNKLNSIYGMSAQNPVKQSIIYDHGEYTLDPTPIEELLEQSNKRAFMPYQWGVFTTAWARWELYRGRKTVTDQGGLFIYCDTDSVKYLEDAGPVSWEEYNKEKIEASTASGAYATDPKGVTHYMGVYEDEGEYEEFATRGAKKYVCRKHGKLTATISGVSTREDNGRISGGMELEAAGGVKAFLKPVFEFKQAGGVELKYNDKKRFTVRIEGRDLKIRECVTIAPSTYRLSDTDEYSDLLALTRAELREYLFDAFGRRT